MLEAALIIALLAMVALPATGLLGKSINRMFCMAFQEGSDSVDDYYDWNSGHCYMGPLSEDPDVFFF